MPDYPPGYDPSQADYGSGSFVSPTDQAIGGLIGLAAFGAIGAGAFLTTPLYAGNALSVTTASGNVYWGVTLEYAEAQELMFAAGTLTQEAATTLQATAIINGGNTTLSVVALLSLFDYEEPHIPWIPGGNNFRFLGGYGFGPDQPGIGVIGLGNIPGLPSYPAGAHGWHRICTVVETPSGQDIVCYYED